MTVQEIAKEAPKGLFNRARPSRAQHPPRRGISFKLLKCFRKQKPNSALYRAKLQQFDRCKIAHVPTNPLGRIEQHMWLRAERIP